MKKIVLIEDNAEVRENTSEILTLANFKVFEAENGKKGVELASRELPDLILCDIMMPELDGYGVLHILSKKPETASIPFIFMTAKTEKSDIRKGMDLGADDYLTKPFDDTDLLNAIEARLKKYSLIKTNYAEGAEGLDAFIQDAQKTLDIQGLCNGKKHKTYKKKGMVFMEGETPSAIFFVVSGSVKTYRSHPDGKEFITNLYQPNDFFGYEAILQNHSFDESAVALEDSELILIPKLDFQMLIQKHPKVSAAFISMLCKKVDEKESQLLNLAYNSVRQRTAESLLKLNDLKKDNEFMRISREDLSKMVGTASESVIRVLSDFREEKLIEIEGGKIKVSNQAKLEKVVRWNVALR